MDIESDDGAIRDVWMVAKRYRLFISISFRYVYLIPSVSDGVIGFQIGRAG